MGPTVCASLLARVCSVGVCPSTATYIRVQIVACFKVAPKVLWRVPGGVGDLDADRVAHLGLLHLLVVDLDTLNRTNPQELYREPNMN